MRKTSEKIKAFIKQQEGIFRCDPAYHLKTLSHAAEMSTVIWEVERALARGIEPRRCFEGTTELYYLMDCDEKPVAIFKIPKYSCGEMMREIAAYRLDHERFAGVPPTVLATLSHPIFGGKREGICQLFIQDAVSVSGRFIKDSSFFSPAQVRRIAALDIRLLNFDRHSSNLLFADERLFPIDHGITLPRMTRGISFVWMQWRQAKTPFSQGEKQYILNLNPEKDRRLLIEEMGIEEPCANLHYFSTCLLKKGVLKGLSAHQIAALMHQKRGEKGFVGGSPFYETVVKIEEAKREDWPQTAYFAHLELERLIDQSV